MIYNLYVLVITISPSIIGLPKYQIMHCLNNKHAHAQWAQNVMSVFSSHVYRVMARLDIFDIACWNVVSSTDINFD